MSREIGCRFTTLSYRDFRSDYNDSAYYSNTPLHTYRILRLPDIKLPVLRTDTINDIEFTLPGTDFGNYIIRDTSMLFYSNSIPDFRSYFKGLYFQMNPGSSDP